MPINAEAVCVPPTLGISRCQGDIHKAGCALSSALKLLFFFLLTAYCDLSVHFLGRGDRCGLLSRRAYDDTSKHTSSNISVIAVVAFFAVMLKKRETSVFCHLVTASFTPNLRSLNWLKTVILRSDWFPLVTIQWLHSFSRLNIE